MVNIVNIAVEIVFKIVDNIAVKIVIKIAVKIVANIVLIVKIALSPSASIVSFFNIFSKKSSFAHSE